MNKGMQMKTMTNEHIQVKTENNWRTNTLRCKNNDEQKKQQIGKNKFTNGNNKVIKKNIMYERKHLTGKNS